MVLIQELPLSGRAVQNSLIPLDPADSNFFELASYHL